MTINIYSIVDDKVKFKASNDSRMRTANIQYTSKGYPFFTGFGRQRIYFSELIKTDHPIYGNKELYNQGIIASKPF